jgi:hypothetical protein
VKLKTALEQDPQDMGSVLDTISIRKGDTRLFLAANALGPIFKELMGSQISNVRKSALKLLDWANQDPTEPSHQAVLNGFLKALAHDDPMIAAWAFLYDGHILGSQMNPANFGGGDLYFIFRLQDLEHAGFTKNTTLIFGRNVFPESELTELFTTSSIPQFRLHSYTPEHKGEFETLFPLFTTPEVPCWSKLEKLGIRNSIFGVDEARHLAKFLESSNVKSVSLSWVVESNSAVVAFISSLSPQAKLNDIELASCYLSDEDVIEIGKHLPPTVRSVSLKANRMGDEGINGFLENVKGKDLEILNLDNNALDGARLARSLHGTKIKTINLFGTLSDDDAFFAFAQNLPDTLRQVIGFTHNPFGYPVGTSLKNVLQEEYPKIEWL